MLRKVIYGLVLAGVIALCYVGYSRWKQGRDMMSGEVKRGPSEVPDTSGTDASVPLPEASPKSTVHVGSPPPTGFGAAPAASGPAGAPAGDSMTPNPPNGMAYAGSGHFQVYRQGNITYRINTDTGQSCVLYATNEEWRKPQVYRHGCGNSAAQ
jgi:hypothetical protein